MSHSSIYEVPIDPDAGNTSHTLALSMIGYNKAVLEVGCSTGYFTKFLVERGCNVVGIEIDAEAAKAAEKWADHVIVGDLDAEGIWSPLEDDAFDVVVLGDVLEHLRDPWASLRAAVRKLKPSGFVVTSLPNIAHGDVRIALLQGKFPYARRDCSIGHTSISSRSTRHEISCSKRVLSWSTRSASSFRSSPPRSA